MLWGLQEGGYKSEVIIFPIKKALFKGKKYF